MDLFIEQRKSIGSQAACTVLDDSPHSVAYEEYQAELAFDRRRVRRRRLLAVLRTLALIMAVPVLLVAVFIASYALTFVLSGASPEEVVEALADCFRMVWENVRSVGASWGIWPFE